MLKVGSKFKGHIVRAEYMMSNHDKGIIMCESTSKRNIEAKYVVSDITPTSYMWNTWSNSADFHTSEEALANFCERAQELDNRDN